MKVDSARRVGSFYSEPVGPVAFGDCGEDAHCGKLLVAWTKRRVRESGV